MKNGDQAEYRDVDVGINNKIYAQILSGLNEGDEIVIGQSSGRDETVSSSAIGSSMGGLAGGSIRGQGGSGSRRGL